MAGYELSGYEVSGHPSALMNKSLGIRLCFRGATYRKCRKFDAIRSVYEMSGKLVLLLKTNKWNIFLVCAATDLTDET